MNDQKKKQNAKEDNLWITKYQKSKNQDYLAKLYERYKKSLFLHILKIVKNSEDAKDLTSESFIKAFENLDKFKQGMPFYPWLSRLATNLCIDQIRKTSRYRFEEIDPEFKTPETEIAVEDMELNKKILQIILKLKPVQKRCFCLFYIHNLSYDEIKNITGFSSGQVRSNIQNGRRKFRILMEQS